MGSENRDWSPGVSIKINYFNRLPLEYITTQFSISSSLEFCSVQVSNFGICPVGVRNRDPSGENHGLLKKDKSDSSWYILAVFFTAEGVSVTFEFPLADSKDSGILKCLDKCLTFITPGFGLEYEKIETDLNLDCKTFTDHYFELQGTVF